MKAKVQLSGRREPLYTLDEIADRLCRPRAQVRGWMGGRHRAANPGAPLPAEIANGNSHRKYYRLSDFKRWLPTIEASAHA